MNEEILLGIYNQHYSDKGSFEDFKKAAAQPGVIEGIYGQHYSDKGSIEDFNKMIGSSDPDQTEPTEEQTGENQFLTGTVGNIINKVPIVGDFIDDMARAVSKGNLQGDSVGESLSLLTSGKDTTDEEIAKFVEANNLLAEQGNSDEFNSFIEAGGFGTLEGWKTFALNSFTIVPEVLASSTAALLGNSTTLKAGATGGAATAGTSALVGSSLGPVGTAIGGLGGAATGAFTAASTVLESSLRFSEILQEELKDNEKEFNAENVKDILEDSDKFNSLRNRAIGAGLTIGVINGLTARIGGTVAANTIKNTGRAGVAGAKAAAVGAVGDGAGEAAARRVAGQPFDITETLLEGIGGVGPAIVTTSVAASKGPPYKLNGNRVGKNELENFIKTATPEQVKAANVEISNDPTLEKEFAAKFKQAEIKEKLPNVKAESVPKVAEIESKLDELKDDNSPTGKIKKKQLTEELNDIINEEISPTDTVLPNAEQEKDATVQKKAPVAEVPTKTEQSDQQDGDGEIKQNLPTVYDFDDTLFDTKTGNLTPLGEDVSNRIRNGEDIEILTARDDDQKSFISDIIGLPENKVTTVGAENSAAKKAEVLQARGIPIENFNDSLPEQQQAVTQALVNINELGQQFSDLDIDNTVGEVNSKINNADFISEFELDSNADKLYELYDKIDADDTLSDGLKNVIKSNIENSIIKLENYELATVNDPSEIVETRAPRGFRIIGKPKRKEGSETLITPERLGNLSDISVTFTNSEGNTQQGRLGPGQSSELTFTPTIVDRPGTSFVTNNKGQKIDVVKVGEGWRRVKINGEPSSSPISKTKQEQAEQNVAETRTQQGPQDIIDINFLSFRDTTKDDNGAVVAATLVDNRNGNEFTINDQDTALDIAIRAKEEALGPIETSELQEVIEIVKSKATPILANRGNINDNTTSTETSNPPQGRDQDNTTDGTETNPQQNNQPDREGSTPADADSAAVPSVQETSDGVQEQAVPEQSNLETDFNKNPGISSNSGFGLTPDLFKKGLSTSMARLKDFLKDGGARLLDELNKRGGLRRSPEVYEAMTDKTNQMNALLSKGDRIRIRLNSATKKWTKDQKEQVTNELNGIEVDNSILSKDKLDSISEIILDMRQTIDALSREISRIPGAVNDVQVEVIQNNLGKYTTRIYEAHRNPAWAEKVKGMPDIWSEGLDAYERLYRSRFKSNEKRLDGLRTSLANLPNSNAAERAARQAVEKRIRAQEILQSRLQNLINDRTALDEHVLGELENMSNPNFDPTIEGNKKGAADISILRQKKDVPASIRKLLGEIRDPDTLFLATIAKMQSNITGNHFQMALLDNDKYFSLDRNESKRHTKRISTKDSRLQIFRDRGINNIWVTPEMQGEISSFMTDYSAGIGLLKALNAMTKMGLTVYSPTTQNRNLFGNIPFMMMNGYFRPSNKFGAQVFKELGIETVTRLKEFAGDNITRNKKRADLIDKMVGLGLLGTNVDVGELNSLFDDSKILKRIGKGLEENLNKNVAGQFTKKWAFDAWKFAYRASDDMFKMVAFSFETKQQAEALYDKKYEDLADAERVTVDQRSAKIVRDTLPNYNETYKFVKRLKNLAVIAPFASFAGEVIRTTIGRVDLSILEIKSGNPKLKQIGINRSLGTGAMFLVTLFAGEMFSDTEDEEYETLMKYYMPPWVNDAIVEKKDGFYEYTNPSTINPIGFLGDFESALKREGMAKALRVLAEPFTSTEPAVEALLQVFSNSDAFGNKIYSEDINSVRDAIGKTADIATFLANKGPTPGVVRMLGKKGKVHDRLEDAKRKLEKKTKAGKTDKKLEKQIRLLERQIRNENIAFTGLRFSILDPERGSRFRFIDEMKNINESKDLYFSRTDPGSTDSERTKAYDRSVRRYNKALNQLRDMYKDTKNHLDIDLKNQLNDFSFDKNKFSRKEKDYITGKKDKIPTLVIKSHFERLDLPIPKK